MTRYFPDPLRDGMRALQFRDRGERLRGMRRLSSPQRNQTWYALWTATNPASPLNVHKDGSTVRVQVKSVSFFTRASGLSDLAQVRYLKALRQGAGAEETFTTGLRPFSTPTRSPRRIPRPAAGIRWASRSWISGRSRRCWSSIGREGALIMIRRTRTSHGRRRFAASHGIALQARFLSPRAAETVPPEASVDSRIRAAAYNGDQVYGCAASSATRSISSSSPARPSSASAQEISKGCPSSARTITCS